jgi:predicted amidophosphoribosyltransferase
MPAEPKASEAFTWPPNEGAITPPASQSPKPSSPSAIARMIESIELDLLGRVGLSFDRWAARTGWEPDPLESFCWRCAGSVGPHEQDGEGCASCRSTKLPWDRAMRLSSYKDEIRDEVLSLKFNGWRPGGEALGRLLGERIRQQLDHAQIATEHARLIPIPMHPLRRIRRGIDHTLVITRAASGSAGVPICRALRAHLRPEQVGMSSTERARNMKGAFSSRDRAIHRTMRSAGGEVRVWILVDDVRTTGATFTAASKTLKGVIRPKGQSWAGTEIWVCSIGVARGRDRREGS